MQTRHVERWTRAALPAILVAALGLTACAKDKKDDRAQCLSPAAVSGLYSGDRSEGVTDDQATWRLGVVIVDKTVLRKPEMYSGMVIGFGATAGNTDGLDELPPVGSPFGDKHLSRPISPPHKEFLVKIGPGDVVFTARMQAEAGSPDCSQKPDVTFKAAAPLETILQPGSPGPVPPDWPS